MKQLKILLVTIFIAVFLVSSPSFLRAAEDEIVMVNTLKYHKSMLQALKPVDMLKVPIGKEISAVGSTEQDPEHYTEGVPSAFRSGENGSMWILDSANKALKLFAADGSLKNLISLANMGPVVKDFAFAADNGFWLLSPVEGYIYRIDSQGKILSRIEGFHDARAIESATNQTLLVDMPMLGSVLRFGADETLKEQYAYGDGLSLIEGVGGRLLGLTMEEKNVKLCMRTIASPAQDITLSEFPLDIDNEKVSYAGAEIIGKDAAGNIYLNLIACHFDGPIYRDRLYRCSPLGKVSAFTDIITVPYLSAGLPRTKIIAPDGTVIFFYLIDEEKYVLAGYTIPEA